MKLQEGRHARLFLYSLLAAISLALASCGGNSSSTFSSGLSSGGSVSNTQPIEVNSGPNNDYTNGLFTTVTICVPGTSTCQDIPNVLVDTGSEGLRLLSSVVTLSLPAVTDNSSNTLQECAAFADGSYVWGPVMGADIQIAGETGSSVPIQLISASPQYPVPNACTSAGGVDENTVARLGANGVLGIGLFLQDCGSACTSASTAPALYYLCPNGVCSFATVPLQYQLQNPVSTFAQDNNGVLISLPSISDTGAPSVSGSLIFGVGTQSDNALGNAQIYTVDPSTGNFQTAANSIAFPGFIDSGSNALYFLDATTANIAECTDSNGNPTGFYCPGSASSLSSVDFTVTNTGQNGTTGQVTFSIGNASYLFSFNNGQNWAFNNLGGDSGTDSSNDYFDFGLPFFYGRNVFVGIENQAGPNGSVGPYFAY